MRLRPVLVAAAVLVTMAATAASATAPGGVAPVGAVTVRVDTARPGQPIREALIGTNQPAAGAGPRVAALHPDWGRADMSLDASYDCASGRWNPAPLDRRVALDRAMGATPELIVDYSPPCLSTDPLHEPLDPPDAGGYLPWRRLVERAAYHEITADGVRIFEVWNEPDGTFWHASLADYLRLYQVSAQAVEAAARAAHVRVLVGGPALLFADPPWITALLSFASARHLPVDFLSWHYYGDYPLLGPFDEGVATVPPPLPAGPPYWYNPAPSTPAYRAQVDLVRAMIARFPRLHPLTVIDEWNLDAGYDPRAATSADAAFAAAVLDAMQQAGLDRMAFFRVADDRAQPLGNWGMLKVDLRPKPVYDTFAFWHALAGASLPVKSAGAASAASPVGAVASERAGAYRVLLYNWDPRDTTAASPRGVGPGPDVTVLLAGLGPGRWRYTLRGVDGSSAAVRMVATGVVADGTVRLALPRESIALLTVSR